MRNSSFSERATRSPRRVLAGALVIMALVVQGEAHAAGAKESDDEGAKSDVQRYCGVAASGVNDARTAWEIAQLGELDQRIARQIALLEARTRELEEWAARRDAFMARADENAVAIVAKMKPEAAAAQLGTMEERDAAAFVAKMPPRAASLVLAEMDPARAARLVRLGANNGVAAPGATP